MIGRCNRAMLFPRVMKWTWKISTTTASRPSSKTFVSPRGMVRYSCVNHACVASRVNATMGALLTQGYRPPKRRLTDSSGPCILLAELGRPPHPDPGSIILLPEGHGGGPWWTDARTSRRCRAPVSAPRGPRPPESPLYEKRPTGRVLTDGMQTKVPRGCVVG